MRKVFEKVYDAYIWASNLIENEDHKQLFISSSMDDSLFCVSDVGFIEPKKQVHLKFGTKCPVKGCKSRVVGVKTRLYFGTDTFFPKLCKEHTYSDIQKSQKKKKVK